jgi:hypothetical protein
MSLELHIFSAREFIRMGAHGQLDWNNTRALLTKLAAAFVNGRTNLAILDVRDASSELTDDQLFALVHVFRQAGFRPDHRLAVLHRPFPHARSDFFAAAAVHLGFSVGSFDSFERAVEWLSRSGEPDPDFDRATYHGPTDQEPEPEPPHQGHGP